ncbi:MAG: TRM11 family SAM-dependent methyltransferase [Armatimonadota bacterium]
MSGETDRFFYRIAQPPGHHELARLEFRALTGDTSPPRLPEDQRSEPTDVRRLAWGRVGVDVARSAYITECCRLLARGRTLEDLLGESAKLGLRLERFRIRARNESGRDWPGSQNVEHAIADTISGSPDLTRPAIELVAWGLAEGWLLGERVSHISRGWVGHEQRPFQYSSALPPRIARALVNLVALPGDSLIDPCCGSGTTLVEAGYMGVEPFGWEINQNVAEQCALNLCHHGQAAWMVVGDGRTARGRWDGAVLDLPYGIANTRVERECRELIAHALDVARLVAIVTVGRLDAFLTERGATVLGTATVAKTKLERRVYWVESGRA